MSAKAKVDTGNAEGCQRMRDNNSCAKIPVTLVAIDGSEDPSQTVRRFVTILSQAVFADSLLITAVKPEIVNTLRSRIRCVRIRRLGQDGYNRFCMRKLHKYVRTSHALTIQADSGIHNVEAWTDDWLEYDYIGAPWPVGHGGYNARVGNSGFCLRSKKLLKATSRLSLVPTVWNGEELDVCVDDVVTCCMNGERLTREGLRFAPVEVAARFAFEQPVPGHGAH